MRRLLFKYNWLFGQEVEYVTLLTDQSELSFKKMIGKRRYTEVTTYLGL
jgi:hypothetical protein